MDLELMKRLAIPEVDPLEEAMRAALVERGQSIPHGGNAADPLAAAFAAPAGVDQYVIDVPRGIERDGDFEAKARQWFHEAGLPQGLARGIVQEYCRCLAATSRKTSDENAVMAALAHDWGGDCSRKIALARSVIARCGDVAEIEDVLSASGLGNNPWLIRSLAAFAEVPRGAGSVAGDRLPDGRLMGDRP